MKQILNTPHAPSLLESMRAIGYSLESALADLVDNSLSANAKKISLSFRAGAEPYIAVLDDGDGLSDEALQLAMRHGSTSPLAQRGSADLGRYGLGLKTASLSQCREMTVVSMHQGSIAAYRWDLDVVMEAGDWMMLRLDKADLANLPVFDQLREATSGTLVLWRRLDRLTAGESSVTVALGREMDRARVHLALVFHRFMTPDRGQPKVTFSINGQPVVAVDPFMSEHRATQTLPEERFQVDGSKVIVKPFILPHASKLTQAEIDLAGGIEGLRSQQGFYVYRNRRLIVWGTWFRLARKDELSKLARVKVDIPNALDHLWTLDIKKSTAYPPEAVRNNLRRTIEKIREISGRTIAFRGRNIGVLDFTPGWNEVIDRDGVRFDINRSHPLLQAFRDQLPPEEVRALEALLTVIEASFPAHALYSRMAADHKPGFNGDQLEAKLRSCADDLLHGLDRDSPLREQILSTLEFLEPFNLHPEFTRKIVQEQRNA